MSESNSLNNEEKTEQNLERPDDSPSEEENQSPETQLDEAMREKESMASDTLVPPPDHGWLEQFEAFGVKAFQELEAVALQGLVTAETDLLISLAVKLLNVARSHDPDAFEKAIDQLT